MSIEPIIVSNLIYNPEYRDQVLLHIKAEYFQDKWRDVCLAVYFVHFPIS
jgi:hypothetical protein